MIKRPSVMYPNYTQKYYDNVGISNTNLRLPTGRGVGESPHAPGVAVLVADLLLHLGVGERLQVRGPLLGL